MRRLIGVMLVSGSLWAAGCGGDSGHGTTSGEGPARTTGEIGVKECDDYVARMEACLPKMPEAARGPVTTALANQRAEFKRMADTSQGRATLTDTCKTLLSNVERNPACKS